MLLLCGTARSAIVSSVIVEDSAQIDGRRYIRERHTDSFGVVMEVLYLGAANTNAAAVMAARVASLEESQKQNEISANVANALSDDTPAPTFRYSTAADLSAELRRLYKTARGRDAFRLGWYIESFDLTNAQLRNLFGIQAGQEAAVNAKLDDFAAKYEAMREAVGE